MHDQEVRRVVADVIERFWKWFVCVYQRQLSSCWRHEFGHCGGSVHPCKICSHITTSSLDELILPVSL
jgi:hypothetical protein